MAKDTFRTQTDLDSLPTPAEKPKNYKHENTDGLWVRVHPSGTKSFLLYYGLNGYYRCLTLGKYPKITLDTAVKLAKAKNQEVAFGHDPCKAKRDARNAPVFSDVLKRFFDEYVPRNIKPSTAKTYQSISARLIAKKFGKEKVDGITAPMVYAWHQSHHKTPRQANQALSILSRMFNQAIAWGLRSPAHGNPCKSCIRFHENKSDRALSPEELCILFNTLETLDRQHYTGEILVCPSTQKPLPLTPRPAIALAKLLLFTGARLGELLTLKWENVKLSANPPVLILDKGVGKEIKKDERKVITLSAEAVELLKSQEKILGNPFVFPGARTGKHIVGIHRIWKRIFDFAGLEYANRHAMRHTFGTLAGGIGLSGPAIQAALNHADPSTTARYINAREKLAHGAVQAVGEAISAMTKTS
jgi:integrase